MYKKKPVKPGSKLVSSFQIMPDEMLEKIFNFLSLKEKRIARFVCRRWFHILNYDGLMPLNVQLNDKTFSSAKYFTVPHLTSLTVKKLTRDLTITYGPTTVPPLITKLILQDGISLFHLTQLLKYYACSNVKQLDFSALSLESLSFKSGVSGAENLSKLISSFTKWSCLQSLKFSAERRNYKYLNDKFEQQFEKHIGGIAKLLKYISLPTLGQLSLHLDSVNTGSSNYYQVPSKIENPFQNILLQLVTFLKRHASYDNLKSLELKANGRCYIAKAKYSPELWKTKSMVQLDSIKFDLRAFCFDYIHDLLSTQVQVKHIEAKSFHDFNPNVMNQFLTSNAKTLESIDIHGYINRLSLPSSCTALKCLTIGYYSMDSFTNFLTRTFQQSASFPQLDTFTLVDANFLTLSFGLTQQGSIQDVSTILQFILECFPRLQTIFFITRGDTKYDSKIDSAAASILEQVQTFQRFYLTVLKIQMILSCKLLFVNSDTSEKKSSSSTSCSEFDYYERVVEVKPDPLRTNILPQPEHPLF